MRKSKEYIKKQLNESIIDDKSEKIEKSDKVAEIVSKLEYIIIRKNRNIISLAKIFSAWLTSFSIAYLQPALQHKNFSNDVTNY